MTITRANPSDIPALAQLRVEYLQEDLGPLDPAQEASLRAALPGYFQDHLERDLFCYLLREEDEIAACAFLLLVEKPMSPSFPNGRTGTLLNVYTRPAARRRGFARRVLEALMADAEALDLCLLELKATEDGYALYKSLGFADDAGEYRPMRWRRG